MYLAPRDNILDEFRRHVDSDNEPMTDGHDGISVRGYLILLES